MIRSNLRTPQTPLKRGALASCHQISHPHVFSRSCRLFPAAVMACQFRSNHRRSASAIIHITFSSPPSWLFCLFSTLFDDISHANERKAKPSRAGFLRFFKNFFQSTGLRPVEKTFTLRSLCSLHLKKLSPALRSRGFCRLQWVSKDK